MNKDIKIVFFGTPEFSVKILETMDGAGFTPMAVVTAQDKPKGRKMILSPTPVKEWAQKKDIKIEHDFFNLKSLEADLFVVASYGKILPKEILEIPKHGTLNVHPSLLPELRGPSPIQTAILEGKKETGVTIMLMNEKMDEGPLLTNCKLQIANNVTFKELENYLAELGGKLLIETIPNWINGKIKPQPQNNKKATYSKIIKKSDGEINWDEPIEKNYNKIRAFTPWPSAFYFKEGKRIIITKATLQKDGKLQILRIKPEGKNERDFNESDLVF